MCCYEAWDSSRDRLDLYVSGGRRYASRLYSPRFVLRWRESGKLWLMRAAANCGQLIRASDNGTWKQSIDKRHHDHAKSSGAG